MSTKNIPEISRICNFERNDVIQIFGENLDENTQLYIWHGVPDSEGLAMSNERPCYTEEEKTARREWMKNYLANPNELDTVISAMPVTPPEDSKVYPTDYFFDRCIYFGDKEPEEVTDRPYYRTPGGTCVCWLKNEAGFSKPAIANRPQIWNTSSDRVRAGDHLMIFGDAFGEAMTTGDGGSFSKRAAIRNIETEEVYTLESARGTAYKFDAEKYVAEYTLPSDLPIGKYKLYFHSGTGQRFGWSEPFEIEVIDSCNIVDYYHDKWSRAPGKAVLAPECETVTVYADDASPFADYYDKIQSAIDSLNNGGIVALSYGTFPISKPLNIKSGVMLVGSGNATVLKATTSKIYDGKMFLTSKFATKPFGLKGWANDYKEYLGKYHNPGIAVRVCDNAGIDSVKIELGNGIDIGVLVADDKSENLNNAVVNNIEVDGCGLNQYVAQGKPCNLSAGVLVGAKTYNMVIWNCVCKAFMPLYILPARHTYAKIVNNEIICRPRQIEESMLSGLRYSIISNNVFADGRRSFVTNQGFSHNWVYQNRSVGVDRAPGACESYMSEHGDGEWIGHSNNIGSDFIEIESKTDIMFYSKGAPYDVRFDSYERFLFIVNGIGFGQYRKIIDVAEDGDKKKLFLDKPWDVMPDETTAFLICFGNHHNLYVDNETLMSNGNTQFVWGCGFDNVYTGHKTQFAGGINTVARLHLENELTGDVDLYPDALMNKPERLVNKKIVTGVIAFNRYQQCEAKLTNRAVQVATYPHFGDVPELWQDLSATRGIFGNTVKECSFSSSNSNYGLNILLRNHSSGSAGVSMGGGFNRIIDNMFFGHKTPIVLLDNCLGNCISRNVFKDYEQKVVGVGKPCGRDIADQHKF